MLGTPRPLSLKMTSSPTRIPQKLGESGEGKTLKCCKTFFIKGCKGKLRPFSNATSKKSHHLGHLDDVGGQHVRAPNLDPKWGPIPGCKDLTI